MSQNQSPSSFPGSTDTQQSFLLISVELPGRIQLGSKWSKRDCPEVYKFKTLVPKRLEHTFNLSRYSTIKGC